ncbi:MAG: penicillin-binding protein 1C [Spirochaetales bacterium]|nr:penicillin-binding protein 1C [Spirochaetales bacterium]
MGTKHKFINLILIIIVIIAVERLIIYTVPSQRLNEFEQSQYSVRYYDRSGKLLRWTPAADGSWQTKITLTQVPPEIIRSILKAEDRRFYWHGGTDIPAVLRGLWQNMTGNRVVSGASTITMQLARLIYPHSGGIKGKLYETIMARILEIKKSKKWILEQYINNIPFGYNTKGYAAASEIYFGKALIELSPEETAILCIIPRAPTKYNPFHNKEDIHKAASLLLRRLHRLNDKAESAIDNILSEMTHITRAFDAPHFVNHLQNVINKEINPEKLRKIKSITTTLDIDLQHKIENIVAVTVDKYRNSRLSNAAVLVLNKDNEVITYIGSRDFFNDEICGQIDGVQIKNQPGSTLKPFLYALAFESSFSPDMILPDIPMNIGGEENYAPHNYNLRTNGPVRMRVALASSLNIPAVYLINRIGVQNFSRHLSDLGFSSLSESTQYPGLGLALGNAPVRLAELAAAFSVFSHKGMLYKPNYIRQIIDEHGMQDWHKTESHSYMGVRIYSEESSFLIYDILCDDKARSLGFGNANFFGSRRIAAKTGTSNQFGNIWALATCPEYTIAVWGGNFNGNTIHGVPGAAMPLAIVKQIVESLGTTPTNIQPPNSLSVRPICTLSGQSPSRHCHSVTMEYYNPAKNTHYETCTYHKAAPNGTPYIAYPAEYVTWAANNKKLSQYQKYEIGKSIPQIISPTNKSVFYLDKTINDHTQTIRLSVSYQQSGNMLYYTINDGPQQPLPFPYQTNIPIHTGIMCISVTDKSKTLKDEVEFIVK